MKWLKYIGLVLLTCLAGIQFFPARPNQGTTGSPDDFILKNKTPENIGKILNSACYNCHSNHTEYPWYNKIQPVGWFLESHIQKGKRELNLSEFGSYSTRKQKSKIESMIHQVEKNQMPLPSYRLMHPEARLTEKNKLELISWLKQLKDSQ